MAMSISGMKAAIKAAMISKGFNPDHPSTNGEADAFIEAIAEGVYNHITTSAKAVDEGGTSPANWSII